MSDQLKMLASSHHDGRITWWILPYTPPRMNRIIRELEAIVPRERWEFPENTFVLLEGRAIEVEVSLKDATREEMGIATYWAMRNGSTANNWELFEGIMSPEILKRFLVAYEAIAGNSMSAPKEVQNGDTTDPQP